MQTNDKAKFFAQYLYQKVLHVSEGAKVEQYLDCGFLERFCDTGYLLLRPLSDITDEETIEVAILSGFKNKSATEDDMVFWGKEEIKSAVTDEWAHKSAIVSIRIYQYLQSRSFALPWRSYTVEQIIALGWVKLK